MEIPKKGKYIAAGIFVLLSVLVSTWIGGCWHKEEPMDDEDRLLKGYRLSLELKYEEAYGSFRVAWILAHIDGNEEKEQKALRGMADCAFWIGAVDSCIYRYNQALELARKQDEQMEEYDIYTKLRQAYMAKVDMENVLVISQKIDSLMSVTDNKRIRMDMQQRLAMEALQQQNPKLAEQRLIRVFQTETIRKKRPNK